MQGTMKQFCNNRRQIRGTAQLRTIGGSSSGPADLLIFNILRISPIHLVLMIRFFISGYCICNWGSGVSFGWRVEMFPKMEAIKSALLFESETTVPSVLTSGDNDECLLKSLLKEFKVDQKILLSFG